MRFPLIWEIATLEKPARSKCPHAGEVPCGEPPARTKPAPQDHHDPQGLHESSCPVPPGSLGRARRGRGPRRLHRSQPRVRGAASGPRHASAYRRLTGVFQITLHVGCSHTGLDLLLFQKIQQAQLLGREGIKLRGALGCERPQELPAWAPSIPRLPCVEPLPPYYPARTDITTQTTRTACPGNASSHVERMPCFGNRGAVGLPLGPPTPARLGH